MYNKKAVSDVVSTVLIILLVVAAIAIIGAIILNTVGRTSTQVDTAVACQSLDIKAVSCVKAGNIATVTVSRGSGGSDIQVSGVTAIFSSSTGATVGATKAISPVPTAAFSTGTATSDNTAGITQVKIAAQITGASQICPASASIACA